MSVLPVSIGMEISSKEQILHLDSSRRVKGSPAQDQICSVVSGLEVTGSFVTTSFQDQHIQKLIPLSFHSNYFFCMF